MYNSVKKVIDYYVQQLKMKNLQSSTNFLGRFRQFALSLLIPLPHFNVGSVLYVAREFPSFFDLHTFNIEVEGGGRGKDAEN